MSMIYPTIENADEILREKCYQALDSKIPSDRKPEVEKALEEELNIIKRQGAASGYLTVSRALDAVISQTDKVCCKGVLGASLVAYLLSFSHNCPVNTSPALYPIFIYGFHGDRLPVFEFSVSPNLYSKLMDYFEDYSGADEFGFKRIEDEDMPYGVILERSDATDDDEIFYFNFIAIDDEDEIKEKYFSNDITSALKAKSRSDFIKAYGLKTGTGTWEGNAEELIKNGVASIDEIITSREDLFEFLLEKGIDEKNAYEIADYTRRGCANRRGWKPGMLELLKDHDVPEWYIHSCEQVKYLFTRAHAMEILSFLNCIDF